MRVSKMRVAVLECMPVGRLHAKTVTQVWSLVQELRQAIGQEYADHPSRGRNDPAGDDRGEQE